MYVPTYLFFLGVIQVYQSMISSIIILAGLLTVSIIGLCNNKSIPPEYYTYLILREFEFKISIQYNDISIYITKTSTQVVILEFIRMYFLILILSIDSMTSLMIFKFQKYQINYQSSQRICLAVFGHICYVWYHGTRM